MGIDHGALIDICAYVHICRRHHDHRRSKICSRTDAAASRNDSYAVLSCEFSCRNGILVEERELALGHVSKFSETETAQDNLLHP